MVNVLWLLVVMLPLQIQRNVNVTVGQHQAYTKVSTLAVYYWSKKLMIRVGDLWWQSSRQYEWFLSLYRQAFTRAATLCSLLFVILAGSGSSIEQWVSDIKTLCELCHCIEVGGTPDPSTYMGSRDFLELVFIQFSHRPLSTLAFRRILLNRNTRQHELMVLVP